MAIDRNVLKQKISVYANAIISVAGDDRDALCAIDGELAEIVALRQSNNDLIRAFCDTSFSPEARQSAAAEVFADCDEGLATILGIMAYEGDFGLISLVAEEYTRLAEEALGNVIVDVTTVVELDDHLREIIGKKLADDFGKPAILREHIDKSILGGIIMSAHGKCIDASLASKIEEARNVLSTLPTGGER